ncbi:MAG: TIGR00725 family protein, partial [bacterium]
MKDLSRRLRIGVMGAGVITTEGYALAEEIGRRIAEAGAILICGGLGGVMEAAAKGAKSGGGIVIGILPTADENDANPYIDIPIVTGIGHARNLINIYTSHAIIAVHGEYGTLSEIALALKCRKPVIALNTWRLDMIGCSDKNFVVASSPADAVQKAINMV